MFEDWWERYIVRLKLRLFLAVLVFFLFSFVMSCQELRYMTVGKTVDASLVSDVLETRKTREGELLSQQRYVRYAFADGDLSRNERAEVSQDWQWHPGAADKTVRVQYIAHHENMSRLEGQHNWGWVTTFLVNMVLLGLGAWWISRPG